jgi:6-phosphogluconolactonase
VAYRMIQASPSLSLLIFDVPESMWQFAARRFREIVSSALSERDYAAIGLSGGRTPERLYTLLAQGYATALPWEKVHLFLVDERFVGRTDEQSNYRMIKETLLSGARIPMANIHDVKTEVQDPSVAAEKYEDELIRFFGLHGNEPPRFDLVLLGIGEDGHTASLFPGSRVLVDRAHLVRAVMPLKDRTARITITLKVINAARNVVFLVSGRSKAQAIKRLVVERDETLPAGMVRPRAGEALLLCDREAASMLKEVRAAGGKAERPCAA